MTTQTQNTREFWLPCRDTDAARSAWAKVEAKLGIKPTGERANGYIKVAVPGDWLIVTSSASPMQTRLIDGNGNPVAKLFHKLHGGDYTEVMEREFA